MPGKDGKWELILEHAFFFCVQDCTGMVGYRV